MIVRLRYLRAIAQFWILGFGREGGDRADSAQGIKFGVVTASSCNNR